MNQLTSLTRALQQARRGYHKAFREHFENHTVPLPDDRFWQLQPVFRKDVITFRFSYKRTNGIEQAAREFFRKPLAGDFSGTEYTMEEAIQFAKTWRNLQSQLYQPLFDIVQNRGDDAYGDLLDALPLAGRQVVAKAVNRQFADQRQLEEAVLQGCGGNQQLADLILRGENYLGMSLYGAAQDYFVHALPDI